MVTPLRVLLLKDSKDDAELVIRELTLDGLAAEPRRVETAADFVAQLMNSYHVVIADYALPCLTACAPCGDRPLPDLSEAVDPEERDSAR